MELAGIFFAFLGPRYILYSMACHNVPMRSHGYCIGNDISHGKHARCKNGNFSLIMNDFTSIDVDYPVELIGKLFQINTENDFSGTQNGVVDLTKIKDNENKQIGNIITQVEESHGARDDTKIIQYKIKKKLKPSVIEKTINSIYRITLPDILRCFDYIV